MCFSSRLLRHASIIAVNVTVCVNGVQAQQAPDAGQIQRQIERSLPSPTTGAPTPATQDAAPVDQSGPLVRISTFVVEGATLIPTDELVATFEQYRGEQMYLG